MSEEYLGLKVHLQNLSNEAGKFESDMACLAYRIRRESRSETVHDVTIQALGRVTEAQEKLKREAEMLTQVLVNL